MDFDRRQGRQGNAESVDQLGRRDRRLRARRLEAAGYLDHRVRLFQELLAGVGRDHDLADGAVLLGQQSDLAGLAFGPGLGRHLGAAHADGHGRGFDHQGVEPAMGRLAADKGEAALQHRQQTAAVARLGIVGELVEQ